MWTRMIQRSLGRSFRLGGAPPPPPTAFSLASFPSRVRSVSTGAQRSPNAQVSASHVLFSGEDAEKKSQEILEQVRDGRRWGEGDGGRGTGGGT